MAEHGYDAATVAALVDEAGVPASSIYHYFGSKEGVLLAVMERGAERFFEALPILDRRIGSQADHLRGARRDRRRDARAQPGLPAHPRRHGDPAGQRRRGRGPPGRQQGAGDGPRAPARCRCRSSSASIARARRRISSLVSPSPPSTAPSSPQQASPEAPPRRPARASARCVDRRAPRPRLARLG